MADENCPNYYTRKSFFRRLEKKCCSSVSQFLTLGNFGGLGEPPTDNPCFCENYKECCWYLKDAKLAESTIKEMNNPVDIGW